MAYYSIKGRHTPTTGPVANQFSTTSYSFTFLSNEHIIKVEGMTSLYPIINLKG